jgi:hypothetical protein
LAAIDDDGEASSANQADAAISVRLDTANLTVVMIIVGVILAYVLGSTFV